jgi:hypothetical protein
MQMNKRNQNIELEQFLKDAEILARLKRMTPPYSHVTPRWRHVNRQTQERPGKA